MAIPPFIHYIVLLGVVVFFSFRYLGSNPTLIPLQPSSPTTSVATPDDSSELTMSSMKSVAYFVNWVSLLPSPHTHMRLGP